MEPKKMANNKVQLTTEIDTKQLQYESSGWKRALAFMIEENIHLKNRLAEILKGPVDKQILEQAENFQNHFIEGDEFIRLLRDDLVELDRLCAMAMVNAIFDPAEINRKIKKIRSNTSRVENSMASIRSQFYAQFSQAI